jgi:hypothetical protein
MGLTHGATAAYVLVPLWVEADGTLHVTATMTLPTHNLLDGVVHPDTVAGAAAKGYLIVGTDTGGGVIKWQRLAPGALGEVLSPDAGGALAWVDPLTLAHLGYVLHAAALLGFGPANNTNYFFGDMYALAPNILQNTSSIYIPAAGTITAVTLHFRQTGLSTGENSSAWVVVNGAGGTLIVNNISNVAADRYYQNLAMSVAVAAGDRIEIHWLTPIWATNPTTVKISADIYIE